MLILYIKLGITNLKHPWLQKQSLNTLTQRSTNKHTVHYGPCNAIYFVVGINWFAVCKAGPIFQVHLRSVCVHPHFRKQTYPSVSCWCKCMKAGEQYPPPPPPPPTHIVVFFFKYALVWSHSIWCQGFSETITRLSLVNTFTFSVFWFNHYLYIGFNYSYSCIVVALV